MRRAGSYVARALGAAVAVLVLSGCVAQPDPAPTTPPTPSASALPEPTGTPALDGAPATRFEFGCVDFTETVADLLDGPVRLAATVPEVEARPSWLEGPAQYAIAQTGGLVCEYRGTAAGATSAATIFVVADGADARSARAEVYGDAEEPSCTPLPDGFSCSWVDVVAGSYAELRSSGIPVDDAERAGERLDAAIGGIRSYLVALPATDAAWRAPAETVPLTGCEQILAPEALAAALDSPELAVDYPAGGWSIEAWVMTDVWGSLPCYYYEAAADPFSSTVGALTFLPAGAWAFDDATGGTRIALTGDDRALVACGESAYWACTVDVRTGGSWVRWFTDEEPADPAASARDIAEAVVAGVDG